MHAPNVIGIQLRSSHSKEQPSACCLDQALAQDWQDVEDPESGRDRMAKQGGTFTSWYGQASCTAGRASRSNRCHPSSA
jgi:hypothetical protein